MTPPTRRRPTGVTSTYDAAGNMTTLLSGATAVYDAWNRLVEVKNSSGAILEKYTYDGTNRRIQVSSNFSGGTPGTVQDDYLAGQQVIASDIVTGGVHSGYQFVWSPRYIDAPVLRDTLDSNGAVVAADRLFYLGDANYNVTGLVNTSGQVVERYAYTPYGQVAYYHGNDQPGTYADWSAAGSSSAYGNTRLFAGMDFNASTGLYDDRARPYDPALERFIGRDPAVADENLYRYCGDTPTLYVDPSGQVVWVGEATTPRVAPIGNLQIYVDDLSKNGRNVNDAIAEIDRFPTPVFDEMVKIGKVTYGNELVGYKPFKGSKATFRALIVREKSTAWKMLDGGYSKTMSVISTRASQEVYFYDQACLAAHGGEDASGRPTGNALFGDDKIAFATVNGALDAIRKKGIKGTLTSIICFNNPTAQAVVPIFHAFIGSGIEPDTQWLRWYRQGSVVDGKKFDAAWTARHCLISVTMPYIEAKTSLAKH